MDLSTRYLGLDLPHPIVAGASPMADDLDTARRLEDAGVSALVMRSLFAEQVAQEELRAYLQVEPRRESQRDASALHPPRGAFALAPEDYVDQLRRLKEALRIPVIASLSGSAPGRWLEEAALLETVGADAIELNLHPWGADVTTSAFDIEAAALDTVRTLRRTVRIPVAVKVSPYFTALARFSVQLHAAGADALVFFSRALPADIDPETFCTVTALELTRPSELLLRLRWLAIVSSQSAVGLAASGGIHEARDVLKAVMAGAHAVQMVSALLARGPSYVTTVRHELADWLAEHDHPSLESVRGRMSLVGCTHPAVYERSQTMVALQGWQRAKENRP
jgi:dihydroorotate dehydrogenase (fumarate)